MTAAKLLAAARRHLGATGRPNAFTRAYAKKHGAEYLRAAWCDMFVTYVARNSGNAAAILPFGDRAYTVTHAEDGHRLGRWYAGTVENIKAHAKPGCPIFFDWGGTNSRGAIDHIGFIEVVLPDGRVQTIEGNTGGGAGSVKRRVRGADVIAGFWVPDFSKEDDMPLTDADAKRVAKAVLASLTHKITDDLWAGREGIFPIGQKIDPKSGLRQTWAYGKDTNQRVRKLEKTVTAQGATIATLVAALGQGDELLVDELVERIGARVEEALAAHDVELQDDVDEPDPEDESDVDDTPAPVEPAEAS